ncbi:MAG: 1-acyl-sn-glycerol-3-phosphate acyltransferase [Candidatus Omnitrophica bacterium]|nr:1-acyl-sn-glycerol-3-phosphate acyltransferase [Candidatus Omnitrophota bacterium]MCB9719530.1 1-acyl-sn-glycerol-3-phosphate acyltransferase [Candidatus Omnitrophota bacterium]
MTADILCFVMKIISGLQVRWRGCTPEAKQRVYFANHTSHLDFMALWAALPRDIRRTVRPVAAKDYWDRGKIKSYLAHKVIRAVLIERQKKVYHHGENHPLDQMLAALREGASLIIFPEGTRRDGGEKGPGPFKSGLYHLSREYPQAEYVPVFLNNLSRILPKGEFLPVPIIGSAVFGAPLALPADESKEDFLARARQAVAELNDESDD